MGLPLRMTYNDTEYAYQIINSKLINQYSTELELMLDGEKLELQKEKNGAWTLKDGDNTIDPKLIQALVRSVSLRLRV